jgi:hypothetical protein
MVLTGVGLFLIGNGALGKGVLVQPTIAGAPLLVMLVSGAAAVLAGMTLHWFSWNRRVPDLPIDQEKA